VQNLLRLLLVLGLAGSALTFAGSGAAWWFDEDRRLRRLVRRTLGGEPDGVIVARGRNAAAGFRLEIGKVVVMRDGGAAAARNCWSTARSWPARSATSPAARSTRWLRPRAR
jgi:hypothetical protein